LILLHDHSATGRIISISPSGIELTTIKLVAHYLKAKGLDKLRGSKDFEIHDSQLVKVIKLTILRTGLFKLEIKLTPRSYCTGRIIPMTPRTRNLQISAPLPIADLTTVNRFLRYSAHLLHAAISCCRRLAARLKTSVCGRSSDKITGSNLTLASATNYRHV
jgi:hypothetical protein